MLLSKIKHNYLVDQYTKVVQRLNFIRYNHNSIRAEMYDGLTCAVLNVDSVGTKIVLPSTFVGGSSSMTQLYHDAMAIVRRYGKPDLFLTVTCSPKWPEMTNELHLHQTVADRPDLVVRVFKLKLSARVYGFTKKEVFGNVIAYVRVIEFHNIKANLSIDLNF